MSYFKDNNSAGNHFRAKAICFSWNNPNHGIPRNQFAFHSEIVVGMTVRGEVCQKKVENILLADDKKLSAKLDAGYPEWQEDIGRSSKRN